MLADIQRRILSERGLDAEHIDARINERSEARKAKDFARSDAIRDELNDLGVLLMDSPTGTTWRVQP